MFFSFCWKSANAVVVNGRLRIKDKRILYTNTFLCTLFFLVWIVVGYTLDSNAWDDRIWHLDMMGNPGMKKQRVNGTVRIVEKTTENRKTSFCENKGGSLNKNGFMAEPANALSNYAFCVYGFITIASGMQDLANGVEGRSYKYVLVDVPWWSFLLGISQLFMGVGSFVYHAGITRLGQTLDVAGIYIILFNLVVCMLARFIHDVQRWGTKLVLVVHVILLSIAVISDVLFCLYKWNMNSLQGMIGFISCLFFLTVVHRITTKRSVYAPFLIGSILSLALGYLAWIGDKLRWWCDYTSFFQGHACWHVLVATSYFCGYLTVRSEGIQDDAKRESSNDDVSVGIEIAPRENIVAETN